MIELKKQSFSEMFKVYFDKRMIKILLLGAISGFPWVLIGSSLSLWLKEDGLSRSTIGWAGLIFGVYAFNYLWAPLVDRIQLPFLTKTYYNNGFLKSEETINYEDNISEQKFYYQNGKIERIWKWDQQISYPGKMLSAECWDKEGNKIQCN